MAKTKHVFASVYRTSELDEEAGMVRRKIYRPGDDTTGLDKDVKDDLVERGLVVEREDFEEEEEAAEPTMQAGTANKPSKDDS